MREPLPWASERGDKDEEEQDERCDKGHRLVEGQRWPRLCVYVCVCVCELARPCPFSCRKMHSIVYGLHSAAPIMSKLRQSSQVKPILAKGERHTQGFCSPFFESLRNGNENREK